jgi:hypothetical protein
MQLDQAILEDILIASGTGAATPAGQQHCTTRTCGGAEISVVRIFSVLLNLDDDYEEDTGFDYNSPRSQKQSLLNCMPDPSQLYESSLEILLWRCIVRVNLRKTFSNFYHSLYI